MAAPALPEEIIYENPEVAPIRGRTRREVRRLRRKAMAEAKLAGPGRAPPPEIPTVEFDGKYPTTIQGYLNLISPDILPILKEHDVIVSGSLAMFYTMKHYGLTPGFEPGDVDIYVNYHDGYQESNEFFDNLFRLMPDFARTVRKNTTYDGVRFGSGISVDNIRIGKLPDGKKMDVIQISKNFKGTAVDHIHQHFDLDICKCWFDGKQLHGPFELLRDRRCELKKLNFFGPLKIDPIQFIRYVHSIKTYNHRAPVIPGEFDPFRVIKRIRKYTDRGFDIITNNVEVPVRFLEECLSRHMTDQTWKVYSQMKTLYPSLNETPFFMKTFVSQINLYSTTKLNEEFAKFIERVTKQPAKPQPPEMPLPQPAANKTPAVAVAADDGIDAEEEEDDDEDEDDD